MQYLSSPHALLYLTNTSNISHAISRLLNFTPPLHLSYHKSSVQFEDSFTISWFILLLVSRSKLQD